MPKKELPALTSIRFIAALLIFVFHIHIRWPFDAPKFVVNIISQGAVGMSLFFILSGFILTYNYRAILTHNDYCDYFVRRFARVYPVYFIAALLSVPWLLSIPKINQNVLPESIVYVMQLSFIVLSDVSLTQAWFPSLFNYWNNGLAWSLSVEAFLYLLFPFLLSLLLGLNRKKLLGILGISYILSVMPGLAWYLFDPKPAPAIPIVYALPINRLPEFIVGMIFAILLIRKKQVAVNISVKVLAAVTVVIVYLGLVGAALPLYVTHNFLIVPLFAIIIYWCGQIERGPLAYILGNGALRFLGESSYSFYLMQFFPIMLTKQYYNIVLQHAPFLGNIWVLAVVLLLITIFLAAASYKFIELPARRYITTRYKTQRAVKSISGIT